MPNRANGVKGQVKMPGAVLQGVHANYETDLFVPLIQSAANTTKTSDITHPSLKVLSDHIRACTFLISDGLS